jgi:hypothetical protein
MTGRNSPCPLLPCNLGPLFPQSGACLPGQIRNCSLPSGGSHCFLNVPFGGSSLFSSCHASSEYYIRAGMLFCVSQQALGLSGDAFLCALLSSRRLSARLQSVSWPLALRVSTGPGAMPSDDSLFLTLVSLHATVSRKVSCARRSCLLSDLVWPDASFVACLVLEAAI